MKKYISLITSIVLLCLCITSCTFTMTEEERAEYIASHTYEYEVLSAYQYMKPITNNFGGIHSYTSKYYFTYIDDNGKLCEVSDFEHTEYGTWKVYIGNENKYIIQDNGIDTYRYLYLTKETFKSMNANVK